MLAPVTRLTLKRDRLYRKAVLALAEYRHAWDNGASEDKQDQLHSLVCEAVAALRMYDRVVSEPRHVVGTEQFWTLAERYAHDHDFRREMRFPSR